MGERGDAVDRNKVSQNNFIIIERMNARQREWSTKLIVNGLRCFSRLGQIRRRIPFYPFSMRTVDTHYLHLARATCT
jgi:hypothetical protein